MAHEGTMEAVKADLQAFRRMVRLQGYFNQVSPGMVISQIDAILREIDGTEEREGPSDYSRIDRLRPAESEPTFRIDA